jgi:hypothetical protein
VCDECKTYDGVWASMIWSVNCSVIGVYRRVFEDEEKGESMRTEREYVGEAGLRLRTYQTDLLDIERQMGRYVARRTRFMPHYMYNRW